VANWSDVVDLVGMVEDTDEYGFPKKEEIVKKGIFANKKSVRSNEYYMAKQSGIELSYMFEIRSIEYEGEEQLNYEGNEYTIERTYDKGELIELTCKRKNDDHES